MDNNYLKQIINEYPEVWKDSNKLKALLMDFFPQDRVLRNNLFLCAEERIPEELSNKSAVMSDEVYSYKKRLINAYGCSESIAEKSVMLWIEAMDVMFYDDNLELSETDDYNSDFENSNGSLLDDRIDEPKIFYVNINDKGSSLADQRLNGYFKLLLDLLEEKYIISNIIFTREYMSLYIELIDDLIGEKFTENEQEVINRLYGLKGTQQKNIHEIAGEFNVTDERIKQIKNKIFRKFHHPSRFEIVKMCVMQDYEIYDSSISYGTYFENLILKEIEVYRNDENKKGFLLKNLINDYEVEAIKESIEKNDVGIITRTKLNPEHMFFMLSLGCFYIQDAFKYLSFSKWAQKDDRWEAFDYLVNYTEPIVIIKITKYLQKEVSKRGLVSFCELCDNISDFNDKAQKEIDLLSHYVMNAERVVKEKYELLGIDENIILNSLSQAFYDGNYGSKVDLYADISKLNLSVRVFNCLTRAGINTIRDILDMSSEDILKIRNMGRKQIDELIYRLCELGLSDHIKFKGVKSG